jgi:hypothetical protein
LVDEDGNGDGIQLMLFSCWEMASEPRQHTRNITRRFRHPLCLPAGVNVWRGKIWRDVEQTIDGMLTTMTTRRLDRLDTEVFKCPFCHTDYTLRVQQQTSGAAARSRMSVVLEVWRKFGRPHRNIQADEQMFHRLPPPSSEIDADALSARDLRALFESRGRTNNDFRPIVSKLSEAFRRECQTKKMYSGAVRS